MTTSRRLATLPLPLIGLAALAALTLVTVLRAEAQTPTVIDDYARHPDFSISAVSDPRGLWSDGATSWISRDTSGSVKFHACHLEDDPGTDANEYGTREPAKEFGSPSTEANHRTADEGYCYSCEFCPGGVFGTGLAGVPAWNRAERTRATSRDFACRAASW